MRRLLNAPAVHMVLLGTLLWGLVWGLRAAWPQTDERPMVELTAADLGRLHKSFDEQWGRAPTHAQLEALITQEIDQRILVLEARRLGLDVGDRAIHQRLVSKMRAVTEDPSLSADELHQAALDLGFDDDLVIDRLLRQKMRVLLRRDPQAPPVAEQDLAAVLERHREPFNVPARTTFRHVFISTALHGAETEARAVEIADELSALEPSKASALSDPFPLASHVRGSSRSQIARRFGNAFAEQVMSLEPGRWSDSPLSSPFGLHWVWVEEQQVERLPELDEVRFRLLALVEENRAETRLRSELARLRGAYDIRIEESPVRIAEVQP